MEHGIEGPDIMGQWSVELDSHLTILEVKIYLLVIRHKCSVSSKMVVVIECHSVYF
jgi:hypothetical protein